MAKDDDILRDAIIGTEKEIAAAAWGEEADALDPTGDRSLEEMGEGLEGQHEPEDDDDADDPDDGSDEEAHPKEEPENPDEVEAKDKPKEGEVQTPEPQGRVPAGRLREEAERARAAIAERDTLKAQLEAAKTSEKTSLDALRAEFDRKLTEQIAALKGPIQQPEKPKLPDLFEDPNAFAEHINKGVAEKFDAFMRQARDREVNASIDAARTRHGQTFEEAFGALKGLDYKNPDNVALVKRMEAMPNPGEAIVSWHKRNQTLREVGDDPAGYKARITEDTRKSLMADPEFRKELLASLRGEAEIGDQGRPRTTVKLPRSLSQASGNNGRGLNADSSSDGSEQGIADAAWR